MTSALSSGDHHFGINAAIVYYKQKRQLRQLVELPLKYMNVSNVISRLNDTSLMFQLWG